MKTIHIGVVSTVELLKKNLGSISVKQWFKILINNKKINKNYIIYFTLKFIDQNAIVGVIKEHVAVVRSVY